jgi:quercetin dioxygenase-like cupin family protein
MERFSLLIALLCLVVLPALAQDPVKVDPEHYKVEFENAQVRVLRIHHDPHDRAPMHEHPAGVVVWLTEGHEKLTLPDGKTQESHTKAGQVSWTAGTKHAVENLSDRPFEVIFVELKPKVVAAQPGRLSSQLTLLVFKDNSISAVTDYWLEDGQLHYKSFAGAESAVPLERVDLDMTAYLNWQRGAKFVLRPKPGTG